MAESTHVPGAPAPAPLHSPAPADREHETVQAAAPLAESPLDVRSREWRQVEPSVAVRPGWVTSTLARVEALTRLIECTAGLLDLHEVEGCADPEDRAIVLPHRTRDGLLYGIAAVAQSIGDDLSELHHKLSGVATQRASGAAPGPGGRHA